MQVLSDLQVAALGHADPFGHYKGQHIAALCRDLDITCDTTSEFAIRGPDATLVLRWYGNQVVHDAAALRQMGGALAAAGSTAVRVVTGQPVWVSPEVLDGRVATCRDCPTWDAAGGRCRACGCITATKAKLVAATCPLGRWAS